MSEKMEKINKTISDVLDTLVKYYRINEKKEKVKRLFAEVFGFEPNEVYALNQYAYAEATVYLNAGNRRKLSEIMDVDEYCTPTIKFIVEEEEETIIKELIRDLKKKVEILGKTWYLYDEGHVLELFHPVSKNYIAKIKIYPNEPDP